MNALLLLSARRRAIADLTPTPSQSAHRPNHHHPRRLVPLSSHHAPPLRPPPPGPPPARITPRRWRLYTIVCSRPCIAAHPPKPLPLFLQSFPPPPLGPKALIANVSMAGEMQMLSVFVPRKILGCNCQVTDLADRPQDRSWPDAQCATATTQCRRTRRESRDSTLRCADDCSALSVFPVFSLV